jgi:mycothiol synthase
VKPPPSTDVSGSSTDSPLRWIRVPDHLRISAAEALVRESSKEQPSAGRRFLSTAREHGIDLEHFWMSTDKDESVARQACLVVPGAGRTAMVFISTPADPEQVAEIAKLLEHAGAGAPHPLLAQALIDAHDTSCRTAFEQAGYAHLASLLYMRRRWVDVPLDEEVLRLPTGVEMFHVEHSGDDDLARALEASYEKTLDCPSLHGMRDIRDVIESHRQTGEYNPDLWWVIHEESVPLGALLLNPHQDQEGVELVYLGLSPRLRGRGIASAVFHRGLEAISTHHNRTMACAVDANNEPARSFYARFGFETFQTREAYIRAYR